MMAIYDEGVTLYTVNMYKIIISYTLPYLTTPVS